MIIPTANFRESVVIDGMTCCRSLASNICPACAGLKRNRQSLCIFCFNSLTSQQRGLLHRTVGDGYELALFNALRCLGAKQIHLPSKSGRIATAYHQPGSPQ